MKELSQSENINQQNQIVPCLDLESFKSFYYLLKGKRDTDIKLYNDNKSFERSDFIELNSKIYKKLNNHTLFTDMVNVTVGLDSREIKAFGNWTEFSEMDWNISQRVKYIILDWTFQIILPNRSVQIPQEHSVRVKIGNDLNPNELINILLLKGEDVDIEEAQSQMVCKIDFVNVQFCTELHNIVQEWYNGLKDNNGQSSIYRNVVKHEILIRNIATTFCAIGSVVFSNILFNLSLQNRWIDTSDQSKVLFLSLTVFVFIFYLHFLLGRYLEKVIYDKVGKLRMDPIFKITRGDSNEVSNVVRGNDKLVRIIALNILSSFAVTLIGYIFEFFYNLFK